MKKKKINRKLVLNKQTIVHLDKEEMLNMKGGTVPPIPEEVIFTLIIQTSIAAVSVKTSCYDWCNL